MEETYRGWRVGSRRKGITGEYATWAEAPEGSNHSDFRTQRYSGKGATKFAPDEVKREIDRLEGPEAKP